MPQYVIFDSTSEVLRVETSDSIPQVSTGEFAAELSTSFPGFPREMYKNLKFISGNFVVEDIRTLEEAKADKNNEINDARLAANQSYFVWSGKQIACDMLSRSDIDGVNGTVALTGALPVGWPGGWKAIDNTILSIPDVATWRSFYGAMVTTGMLNFQHSQALKATLAAATTIEEVDAISW